MILKDNENKIIIAAGFWGGKMIYKGHDLRLEKSHIRITNLETGYTWTEDTLKDAKNEIDLIYDIRTVLRKEENEESI